MPMKVVVAAFFGLVSFAAPALAVGFQHLLVPGTDHELLEVGIWYPSNATPSPQPAGPFTQEVATDGAVEGKGLPLIVISHSSRSAYFTHYDTALALAQAANNRNRTRNGNFGTGDQRSKLPHFRERKPGSI